MHIYIYIYMYHIHIKPYIMTPNISPICTLASAFFSVSRRVSKMLTSFKYRTCQGTKFANGKLVDDPTI